VAIVFALPPLGGVAYVDWREQQILQQPEVQQLLRERGTSSKELYEKFVRRSQQTAHEEGLAVPDARIISRSQIPTSAWPFPWRLAVTFGAAGFVLGIGASWVIAGFREK
jgi:uncharacterized protein involved in exopolysaccharide biosynthesis